MTIAPDRIPILLSQNQVTGIDFIYVYPDQQRLDIYFLRKVTTLVVPLPGTITADDIVIYSTETELPIIKVESIIGWTNISNQDVLQLKTKQVGDFTLYKFFINDKASPNRIDPYFNNISFSFKANCPSDLDCALAELECTADDLVDFPIDYLARDFWSYRKALLDFASLRYPDWTDKLEADSGVMMAELMSAMGDEMAYYQDRVAREAYLETATQRRSIRKHARLIDYQMHDGLGAKVWIDITLDLATQLINAGENVFASNDNNSKIHFCIGNGLLEEIEKKQYFINALNNEFKPHIWDEDAICLAVGTTELYLETDLTAHLVFDDFATDIDPEKKPGKWLIFKTIPFNSAVQIRTQMVRVIEIKKTIDPVFNKPITHIVWEQAQALQYEFDLTTLVIRGNILPATAGANFEAFFIINKKESSTLPADSTINRNGHDNSKTHLFTLPNTLNQPLVFLGEQLNQFNMPEIFMEEVEYDLATEKWIPTTKPQRWNYKNTLIGIVSSTPSEKDYTLDDGTWQRIAAYQRLGNTIEHKDYAYDGGVTIRFGDGEFGLVPKTGTAFSVKYRLGGTRRSNLAADTITNIALVGLKVTNPIPATGGFDAETPAEVRQLASEAFKSLTYRAVRPEDYTEAAERLPWVQKAGTEFRWTGSWLTSFTTPDPKGKVVLEKYERNELTNQLNRFRQAGREINVLDPIYANIDLKIEVCIAEDAYAGEVNERIIDALLGKKGIRAVDGYFSPDRFTFGTNLDRSTLEAAIQTVQGVKAVEKIIFRRRAWFSWREFTELSYNPGMNSIIRIANDPLHPQRGTLNIYTHGGL